MSKFTDEELKDLSEEERTALLEDIGDENVTLEDIEKGIAGKTPEEQAADAEAASAAAAESARVEADRVAAEAAAAEAAKVAAAEPTPAETPPVAQAAEMPTFTAQAPENADQRLAEINQAKEALAEKFDNGEVTAKDFQKELNTLNKEERDIESAVREARLAESWNLQAKQSEWTSCCNRFLKTNAEYKPGSLRYSVLDSAVKELAKTNPEMSGDELLQKAHERVLEEFPLPGKVVELQNPATAAAPKPAAPVTLAKVPAAEPNQAGENKFARLDQLAKNDPLAYEEAFSKLSDADRNEYLRSA